MAAAASEESADTSNAYIAYFRGTRPGPDRAYGSTIFEPGRNRTYTSIFGQGPRTQWQLDRQAAAVATGKRANQLATQGLEKTDKPPAWNRRLTLDLLRKEAEALIEPDQGR